MVCDTTGRAPLVTITDNQTIRAMTTGPAGSATRPATLARAAALGAATGSRSSAGITALALTSRQGDLGVIASRAGSRPGQVVAPLFAAGELTADKLPFVPSRLGAPGLIPRLVLAATAAAGMAMRDGERPAIPAAVAAGTALGSAVLGVRFRAFAARRLGSDLPGAFAEDALAGTLGWLGARRR
jgi:uncharacterized membrane protein